MSEELVSVRFQPSGKWVSVARGATVREAAAEAGLLIDAPCGGQGNCGKCRVRVFGGENNLSAAERALLTHEQYIAGYRLACQTVITAPVIVETPETSLLASMYKILVDSTCPETEHNDPPVRVLEVSLSEPSMLDDVSDVARLERAIGPHGIALGLLRSLPRQLREAKYTGTAIVTPTQLLEFAAASESTDCLAAAFDIGTTTLAASLVDLRTGQELARVSRLNPQTAFGDDILARIVACSEASKLERLRREIIDGANAMLAELVLHANTSVDRIFYLSFAGNTTMQQLLLGIDPTPIGVAPFAAALTGHLEIPAREIGITTHPQSICYVFPVIAGYVGGDTVAGVLATRFDANPGPALFIDIGTNGEMVACVDGRLVATSCAAGPAFEGARITHGMRAASGAIEAIHFEFDVAYKVIGGGKPVGFCGSALIDVTAELLRVGVLTQTGALLTAEEAPEQLPQALKDRLRTLEGEHAFVVAEAHETLTGHPVAIYQRDIRELQLATAAIRSGVTIMLNRVGLKVGELKQVLVAGAFGNYIRCANAQRLGLLPSEIPTEHIEFVGNTSLAGARRTATSLEAQRIATEIARRTEHIDLSLDPEFQDIYVDALFFPEIPPQGAGA